MLKYRKPLLVNDLQGDPRFKVDPKKDQPIRSVLSVPLLFKGRMMGSLNVFNKRTVDGFTEADRRLLSIIGTESAQVIENARLHEEPQTSPMTLPLSRYNRSTHPSDPVQGRCAPHSGTFATL